MPVANYASNSDMRNHPELSPWWTVKMAADYMRVSEDRVRILVKQGRIGRMTAGTKMLLLFRDDILEFKKKPGGRPSRSKEQQRDFENWLSHGMMAVWMRTCPPSLMSGRCGVCGKMVGTVIPKWVEGCSVRMMVKHFPKVPIVMVLKTGKKVRGRCPGSGTAPKGWRTVEIPVGRF